MADLKKVSAGARKSAFLRWIYGNLTCFSQEHMQTFGYLAAMLPVVDELYDTEAEKVTALSTYRTFFNTEPQIGTMVVGLTVGLEEARANGEPLDDDTINGIRAGLMGPLAGLGDSIIVGTFIPILLGIALGLSNGGSVLGPLFYIIAWNLAMYFGMKFAFDQGYELGGSAVEALVEERNDVSETLLREPFRITHDEGRILEAVGLLMTAYTIIEHEADGVVIGLGVLRRVVSAIRDRYGDDQYSWSQ